jgi:hypothetical protein
MNLVSNHSKLSYKRSFDFCCIKKKEILVFKKNDDSFLGDYAVLLQSGFSHSRALLWNFLSATTAIIGFLIGSYTSNSEEARQWIFAATIGMFLYIALVDLVNVY